MWNLISKGLAAVVLTVTLAAAVTAAAEETAAATAAPTETATADDWKFGFELYGYLASIGGEAANGQDFDIDFSDILDNLDFAFMGTAGAYKGKWSFVADALYMDVSKDEAGSLTVPLTSHVSLTQNVKADVGIETWVVTPSVGYDLVANEKASLTILAGARYMWLKTSMKVSRSNQFKYGEHKISESQSNWDGIVGVRGQILLTEKWFLPYYADIGTGDSDLTWQVMGGVGYRFKHFDLVGGYRYMAWNFGGGYIIDNINLSGPMVGVKFIF